MDGLDGGADVLALGAADFDALQPAELQHSPRQRQHLRAAHHVPAGRPRVWECQQCGERLIHAAVGCGGGLPPPDKGMTGGSRAPLRAPPRLSNRPKMAALWKCQGLLGHSTPEAAL